MSRQCGRQKDQCTTALLSIRFFFSLAVAVALYEPPFVASDARDARKHRQASK